MTEETRCPTCGSPTRMQFYYVRTKEVPANEPYTTENSAACNDDWHKPPVAAPSREETASDLLKEIWREWEYFDQTGSSAWNPSIGLFDRVKLWAAALGLPEERTKS